MCFPIVYIKYRNFCEEDQIVKKTVLVLAVVTAALMLCACSANTGIITPVDANSKEGFIAFEEAGSMVTAARQSDTSVFTYKWDEPIEEARIWAELYRDGMMISDPVEIRTTNLTAQSGLIALFTEEAGEQEQGFTLLLTNGTGADAKAYLQTGSLELGEALKAFSSVQIEDTQIVQSDETNVLLVMHDGPSLTTEMNNDLNDGQTEQLINGSTYTLVLNCMFA